MRFILARVMAHSTQRWLATTLNATGKSRNKHSSLMNAPRVIL